MDSQTKLTSKEWDFVNMLLLKISNVHERIINTRTLPYYKIFGTERERQKDLRFLNRRKDNLIRLYNQTIKA